MKHFILILFILILFAFPASAFDAFVSGEVLFSDDSGAIILVQDDIVHVKTGDDLERMDNVLLRVRIKNSFAIEYVYNITEDAKVNPKYNSVPDKPTSTEGPPDSEWR